jgi:hypothetical protein
MLDWITPADQRGYVQGLNNTDTEVGSTMAPFAFGLIADSLGINACIWVTAAISFRAGFVNSPLIFNPRFSIHNGDKPDEDDATIAEVPFMDEEDMIQKAGAGEYVPLKQLFQLNVQRIDHGEPLIRTSFGNYDDHYAAATGGGGGETGKRNDYVALRDIAEGRLAMLKKANNPVIRQHVADQMNLLVRDEEATRLAKQEMGEWFADYMLNHGYHPGEVAPVLKRMIESTCPAITQHGVFVTPDTLEARYLNIIKILNSQIQQEEGNYATFESYYKKLRRSSVVLPGAF